MRVAELAIDLGVSSEVLLSLLRTLRISATDKDASVSEGDVALILARLERERRSGHKDSAEAIEAAIVDAGVDPTARAEELGLDQWAALASVSPVPGPGPTS